MKNIGNRQKPGWLKIRKSDSVNQKTLLKNRPDRKKGLKAGLKMPIRPKINK
jgi:hypothetical protein